MWLLGCPFIVAEREDRRCGWRGEDWTVGEERKRTATVERQRWWLRRAGESLWAGCEKKKNGFSGGKVAGGLEGAEVLAGGWRRKTIQARGGPRWLLSKEKKNKKGGGGGGTNGFP